MLILDEPTRGVDVGAREEMFRIVSNLVAQGMAIILISSDLAEVVNMSHRVALYRDGRIWESAGRVYGSGGNHASTDRGPDRMKTTKQMLPLVGATIALLILFRIWVPGFLHHENMLDLVQQVSVNAIMAYRHDAGDPDRWH